MSGAGQGVRIAMWSGPRNISTALMRSWGNRPDTAVTDEPLYGYYLRATGLDHPGRDEIIVAQPTEWREVADMLTGPIPEGRDIWYQKHMAHHLLKEVDREWLKELRHCFLIREPEEVLASYARTREHVTVDDLGFRQQAELFQLVGEWSGTPPPVLHARDVLQNPGAALGRLCGLLGVEFRDEMLWWPAGTRPTDGVWAKHWYASVEESTGFKPYAPREVTLTAELETIKEACEPHYSLLYAHRLVMD
ncbi:MAG: HAD family hydrolase [Candidatus Neomarinimicrobiota bacterium]